MANDNVLSKERIEKLSAVLQEEFKAVHGEDVFMDVYVEKFNKLPSMLVDNFNRSAHPQLIAYFLSYALGKPDPRFLAAFRLEACKPWDGQKQELTEADLDQIIADLHSTVDRYLPERHAA